MPSCAGSTTITAIRSNCAAIRRSGIPGLLQAVRAGNVLVANALGSGLLESAALPGFLPGICEKLLGEPLADAFGGHLVVRRKGALEFTIEHLDELVIKGSYPSQRFDPIFGNELTGSQREEMIARLRARPQAYVAQELVNFSQAPAWSTTHVGACCRAASACASSSPRRRMATW
jgi:uncharacterized circularly permuted ATP-grasp superfamily protein